MEFGYHILRRNLHINNKGGESLLVMILDTLYPADWVMANQALAV
jgi:hypothetical protein